MKQSRLIIVVATVLTAFLSAPATAQNYVPYWRDNANVAFVRAVNDSTVIELEAQHLPELGKVELQVAFTAWRVDCTSASRMRIGLLPIIAHNEAEVLDALQRTTAPVRMIGPEFSFSERDGSRMLTSCIAVRRARK